MGREERKGETKRDGKVGNNGMGKGKGIKGNGRKGAFGIL